MFTLTVFPDGKLILTTEDQLTDDTARRVIHLFKRWKELPENEVLVIPGTRVQHATSIEVDPGEMEGVEG